MNKQEIEAYKAGFLNGVNAKDNCEIQIMGYDLFTIFDVLEKHMTDKPKVKMTRAQAIEKFAHCTPVGIADAEFLINFYIEAGMLEVVEEKEEANPLVSHDVDAQLETVIHYYDGNSIHKDKRGKLSPNGGQLIINQLAKLGYKITKA